MISTSFPGSISTPVSSKIRSRFLDRSTIKSPSICAESSPSFIRSDETRSPVRAPSESTMIDLPEPVSPVKRLSPRPNSISTSSIRATRFIFRRLSIQEPKKEYQQISTEREVEKSPTTLRLCVFAGNLSAVIRRLKISRQDADRQRETSSLPDWKKLGSLNKPPERKHRVGRKIFLKIR